LNLQPLAFESGRKLKTPKPGLNRTCNRKLSIRQWCDGLHLSGWLTDQLRKTSVYRIFFERLIWSGLHRPEIRIRTAVRHLSSPGLDVSNKNKPIREEAYNMSW